jgi:hypothetical protein
LLLSGIGRTGGSLLKCFNELQKIPLDVKNSDEVSSHKSIQVILGVPPAHLLILSGIAIPSWSSGGNMDGAEVIVNLRIPATQLLQWTASIGLASIVNEDTDFTFGADQVELQLVNGNLELHACIVVQGGWSYLNRFSYDVTAVVQTDEALIGGTIRWQDGTLAGGPAAGSPWFQLRATTHVDDGTDFGRDDTVQLADTGAVQPSHSGNINELPYMLHGVPFGVPVTVEAIPNALPTPPGHKLQIEQTSGPVQPITLTGQRPQVLDLDFLMTWFELT